jgi:hypothetical protein
MCNDMLITDKIYDQILAVRDSGAVNMLDVYGVQREAYNRELYELVVFLEEHRKEYAEFIMTGKR